MAGQRGPYVRSAALRARLLDGLCAAPGATPAELARAIGRPWGTVAHHLRGMGARGEVRVTREGRRLRYWPQ